MTYGNTGFGQFKTHKVFVSYHHALDQAYRDAFERLFSDIHGIMVSKSVQIGDIAPNLKTDTVRQKIRDEYLRDTTVTVVLVGRETWQRKHVDWEIAASIRNTEYNPRSGLLGILLPTYYEGVGAPSQGSYRPNTIPPRLYHNVDRGYAKLYGWSNDPDTVQRRIHVAFQMRDKVIPDNSYQSFVNNRSGSEWQE